MNPATYQLKAVEGVARKVGIITIKAFYLPPIWLVSTSERERKWNQTNFLAILDFFNNRSGKNIVRELEFVFCLMFSIPDLIIKCWFNWSYFRQQELLGRKKRMSFLNCKSHWIVQRDVNEMLSMNLVITNQLSIWWDSKIRRLKHGFNILFYWTDCSTFTHIYEIGWYLNSPSYSAPYLQSLFLGFP